MSHYDVLGVAPAADEVRLRRAYVALARRYHPDRAGGDAERMRAVNEAWATLSDPERRAAYDVAIGLRAGAPTPQPPRPAHQFPRDPSYPWDDIDPDELDEDDLEDDRPLRPTVKLPQWVGLLPVGLFAGAVGAFIVGVVLTSEPLIGLAFMALLLSCLFFLAAPFIALFASRTGDRRSQQ